MLLSLSLPPLEFCLGTSPIQAEKSLLLPDRNAFGSATLATRAVCQCWTDARYIVEPQACFTGSMPSHDHTIELQVEDLCLQHLQLGAESGDTGAGNLGQPLVTCIGSDAEQLLDTIAGSDRRDDPDLCKMSADDVDHRGLLA